DSWERSGNLAMDLPLPGTYQLRVSGSAGAYSFRMLDLGVSTAVTTDNTQVAGALTPRAATALYSFSGAAGDKIVLDMRTSADAAMRLVDPYGRQVFGPVSFADREFDLPTTGTYTLLIEGRSNNSGSTDDFAFSLSKASDPAPLALTLNEGVAGNLPAPGAMQ